MKPVKRKIRYNIKNSPETVLKAAMEALKSLRSNNCSLDDYLDTVKNDALLRKRLSSLLFSFFRHGKAVDETIKQCCNKPPEAGVKDLLRISMVMAKFQDALAAESVVNIAVTLAKKEFNNFTARFVNAVLRKALPALSEMHCDPLPNKISDRWKKAFTKDVYNSLSELFTQQPVSTVRLRSGFAISDELELEPLTEELPWQFYFCKNLSNLLASNDFAEGKFYIQDPAPAHVLKILAEHVTLLPEKLNFLDLCAAPGGKFIMSMELLKLYGKEVISAIAFDRSPRRLELVKKNMLRCKIKGSVHSGDASDLTIYPGRTFELVTCDVPCSNSGVFRRRPDALWHWSKNNMLEIADLQTRILDNASRLTAGNGLLLYSTCSLEEEENSLQISNFLKRHKDFELIEEKLFMPQSFCDGTYAALLRKMK